jgi:hypothetical protein
LTKKLIFALQTAGTLNLRKVLEKCPENEMQKEALRL